MSPTYAFQRISGQSRNNRFLFGLMLLTVMLLLPSPLRAQDVDCTDAFNQAQNLYYDTRFEESIALLRQCLRQGAFSQEEQEVVYALLGKVLHANSLQEEAKEIVRVLISLVPTYQPDPVQDDPTYVDLVNEVREEIATEEAATPEEEPPAVTEQNTSSGGGGISKWLLIGGGAVVAGTAVLLLSGGGGGGSTTTPPVTTTALPGPPGLPGGN